MSTGPEGETSEGLHGGKSCDFFAWTMPRQLLITLICYLDDHVHWTIWLSQTRDMQRRSREELNSMLDENDKLLSDLEAKEMELQWRECRLQLRRSQIEIEKKKLLRDLTEVSKI